ncbi:hypothetical protein GW17_00017942, partial [Ensete ventricosum]
GAKLETLVMAAASGNAVADPIQLPVGGGASDAPQQWFMDERDGFISWLRGEFAAANAIIDLLMHHLRITGEPEQYDHVAECIHQRRFHWAPILHLQQYFPVANVMYALQQVEWKQRPQIPQRRSYGPKENGRKTGFGHGYGHRYDGIRDTHGSPASGMTLSDDVNTDKRDDKLETYNDTSRKSDAPPHAEKDGEGAIRYPSNLIFDFLIFLQISRSYRAISNPFVGFFRTAVAFDIAAQKKALLVMEGKSADLAKRAIPSLRKQRILLTFGKSQPKNTFPSEGLFSPSSAACPASASSSARPTNFSRHPPGRKLQVPPIHPQSMSPPNGVQSLFVAPPTTAGRTVAAPPMHPTPRFPVPGTGVFLPPGSVHLPPPSQQLPVAPISSGAQKPNCNNDASPKNIQDLTRPKLESDGCLSIDNASPDEQKNVAAKKLVKS